VPPQSAMSRRRPLSSAPGSAPLRWITFMS
jgi:hypothetical protein